MKHMKKTLAWLLVFCMVLGVVPSTVFAAEEEPEISMLAEDADTEEAAAEESNESEAGTDETETEETETEEIGKDEVDESVEEEPVMLAGVYAASTDTNVSMASITKNQSVSLNTDQLYKIFHLDCGRKYFSVDQIKAIIDVMAENDYNTLELAVGNDGLRFLLDDMSVTANGTTYSSDAVKTGIQNGNKAYYDAGTNELTQTEMDTIIAYAGSKGISIIPLINTPGHMDAILTAATEVTGTTCAYNGSSRTIDVTNATAVNFTLALVEKYIAYFAGKGCTVFNMGCDEYANDIYTSGSMGFGNLVSSGKYSYFIDYVNNMAAQVQNAGMTAMAFNDGFYFNGNTSSGTFDTNIAVSFWSSGWSGYTSMSASNLAAKGHKIINTNGDWYYILKTSSIDSVITNITNTPYNSVMGSGTMDVAGCMICFWCDTPSRDYDDTEVANLTTQIRTFASVNSSVFDLTQDEAVTITDENTSISVTAPNLTGLTVKETAAPSLDWAERVVAYDVTPSTEDGSYTGEGTVKIPVPEGWDVNKISAFVVNDNETVEKITEVTVADGVAEYTAPHFSVTGLAEEGEGTKTETVTLVAGGTAEIIIAGENYAGTYTTEDSSIATVNVTGKDAVEAVTTYGQASVKCDTLISGDSDDWKAASGYYYKAEDGNYYPVYAKRSSSGWIRKQYTYTWGYSETSSESNVTGISTQQTTNTNSTPVITVYTQSTTPGTPASTTITFTAAANAAGKTTYVTIGNTQYTIHVVAEDLGAVEDLKIEYWITNGRPTDDEKNNSYAIKAQAAYGEEGLELSKILPVHTTKESRALQYWRCRLLDTTKRNSSTSGTEKQTEVAGDDETYNGTKFTRVRYWNGTWSVYTENNEWVDVTTNHQLVAYYLEILPISDELTVTAADYGKKGDGSTSGDYLEPSNSCTVSVQVVYEDGTTNPAGTTAEDLRSCTIAYGYWSGGRGVGTLNLIGLEGYQIWKVEAETGSETYTSDSTTWGFYTVDTFTWDNNAMTVYEGDPVDSYIIHNDAHYPSTEGYYANLMWDENNEAILIKVYVKAKSADDNLKVIYYDEKFGDELYSYNINVKNGIDFSAITPTPGKFVGNAERIDVTGCGIENTLGVTQKFQTDLTKVPEAVGKYDSELYKYTGSVISEDEKTLYLYYTIDTEVLSPMFVIDYGRPFTFSLEDVVNNTETVKNVSVGEKTRYGTLTYENNTQKFTYKPTQVLPNIDVLTINITFDGEDFAATTNAGVLPATTVDYEEGFAALSGFTDGSRGSASQTTQIAGESTDAYGYDTGVAAEGNTCASASEKGSTATFSFTGTGVDLYVNSTEDSGNIAVQVRDASNQLVKVIGIKTTSNSTITGKFSNKEQQGLIAASVRGLTYGTYSIKITTTSDATVYFDGFRVYGTIQDQKNDYYIKDQEDDPTFLELRDYVLTAMEVDSNNSSADVYAQIRETTDDQLTGVVLGVDASYNGQELLENGPKNELFLLPGQSVTFKLTTNREVQVGMKAVNGPADVSVSNNGVDNSISGISTERDMFYTVAQAATEISEKTITIVNDSTSSILSITKVKICDDPDAAFAELTEADLDTALKLLGSAGTEEPEEPEVIYADAVLNISIVDKDGTELAATSMTVNGMEGENAVFTATEIQAAAEGLELPEGYQLEDNSYADVTIVCGETDTVTFQAVKEEIVEPAPEPEPEPEPAPTPDEPGTIIKNIINSIRNLFTKIFGWKY